MGGVCLYDPGSELNKIKTKKILGLRWPPTSYSNTTTNQKHVRAMQEVNVKRLTSEECGGARDSIIGGNQVGQWGKILK